ncbi:MAG: hypothetical protein H6Q00_362 [Holophagaceae bacterium]|nr:hypothetical protein [Holophagaceae bacterium]
MTPPPLLGYRHPGYAESLSAFGTLKSLEHSGGWILERSIPGSSYRDGMGLYPMFCCADWSSLPTDLEQLRGEGLVSLVLVTDPFLPENQRTVFRCFDMARPFKMHYAADLGRSPEGIVSKHHANAARKAARRLSVEVAPDPWRYLGEWDELYGGLVERHRIMDLRRFSRESFRHLLGLPGVYLFRALLDGEAVGAQLFLFQDDIVHAHLAAFTAEGYARGASYLLDWQALEYFHGKARLLNWGGGRDMDQKDGLSWYKQGWSTEQHPSYLLGAAFNAERYASLAGSPFRPGYFPAYRCGEFG